MKAHIVGKRVGTLCPKPVAAKNRAITLRFWELEAICMYLGDFILIHGTVWDCQDLLWVLAKRLLDSFPLYSRDPQFLCICSSLVLAPLLSWHLHLVQSRLLGNPF